jgi:hypothetical protein
MGRHKESTTVTRVGGKLLSPVREHDFRNGRTSTAFVSEFPAGNLLSMSDASRRTFDRRQEKEAVATGKTGSRTLRGIAVRSDDARWGVGSPVAAESSTWHRRRVDHPINAVFINP